KLTLSLTIFFGSKKQIGIYSHNGNVRFDNIQNMLLIFSSFGNINGFEQLIHEFISRKLKTFLQFLAVMQQPTFHIKNLQIVIFASLKTLFKRLWRAVTQHSVTARVVNWITGIQ